MHTIGTILAILGIILLLQNIGVLPASGATWWPTVIMMIGFGLMGGARDALMTRTFRRGEYGIREGAKEAYDRAEQMAYGHRPDKKEK